MTVAAAQTARSGATYRAYVLVMLIVVYTFNFLDRQIIGILAVPIQQDLNLTDTQLSLMGGLAFAILYSTLGVPIAWLADRFSRVWIMTGALTVWSAMTAVCGLTVNFWQLFLARVGVGVGEAGGVAPAYSLIADYYPPSSRARALAGYSLAIPIGSAIGIVLGGVLTSFLDWRWAFFIVGLAGILFAPLFRLTVRDPVRGAHDAGPPAAPVSLPEVFATLARKRSFWLLSFGAASSSMMGYGLFFWIPAFLVRSYATELPQFLAWMPDALFPPSPPTVLYAAYFYGAVVLVGGLLGIWAGGVIADRLGARDRAAYARVPAIAFALLTPLFATAMLSQSLAVTFFVLIVPTGLALAWLGPVLAAFQHIVPSSMRATGSSVFLLINNLAGIGFGNLVIGGMSDLMRGPFGAESLRYALLSCTVFYLLASLLLFLAAPALRRDWEE